MQDGATLVAVTREASQAAEALLAKATLAVRRRVTVDDRPADPLFDREQRATHALAWLATYAESVRQLAAYAERLHASGRLGEMEELLIRIGIGEYLAQIHGGIPMSQGEIARPADVGLSATEVAAHFGGPLESLASSNVEQRARLVELMRAHHDATVGDCGLDTMLTSIRSEMRKFADTEVMPQAQQ